MRSISLIAAVVLWTCATGDMEETAIVHITQGDVRGKKVLSDSGVPYYSFRGIPYAKPPVGPLRFKEPEPAEPWEGVRDALDIAPIAPQMGIFANNAYAGDEDCLFINVFTPKIPDDKQEALKPVMVYIHGGGYYIGSGNNEMHGPGPIMSKGEVVLVTMNYRLGPLGYLSTGDSVVPGNNGMKDQVLSLKWVQQNIAQFGGDPNSVTIAGISAGGSSTNLHMFSPMSKGLFQRVISESGSALSPWSALDPEIAQRRAFRLGEALGLKTNDTKELVEFLMTISAKDLIEAAENLPSEDEKHPLPLLFLPVVERGGNKDTTFLPDAPLNILRNGQYNYVPLISGVTSREGLIISMDYAKSQSWYDALDNDLEPVLNVHLYLEKGESKTKEITQKVRKHYFGDKPISKETVEGLVDLYGDILFNIWADKAAKEHVQYTEEPLYFYKMSFEGDTFRAFGPKLTSGAPHGAELAYMFDTFINKVSSLSTEDGSAKLSERLIRMWLNFATTGNPTPEDDPLLGVTWKPFLSNETNYLDIDKELTIHTDWKKDTMEFWKNTLSENA